MEGGNEESIFVFVRCNERWLAWMAAHIQLARGEVGRSSNLVYVNQPPSSLAELDRLYLRFSLSLFFCVTCFFYRLLLRTWTQVSGAYPFNNYYTANTRTRMSV